MASPRTTPEDNIRKGDRELASAVLSGTFLGRTLRRALESLVQQGQHDDEVADHEEEEEEEEDDNDDDVVTSHHSPPVSVFVDPSKGGKSNCYSVSRTETPQQDDHHHEKGNGCQDQDDDYNDGKRHVLTLDGPAMDRIWSSFGDAVAATPSSSSQGTENVEYPAPPRALLRGRCQYYNRFGKNWMVSIDHVRLKGRPKRLRKRRRRDHMSLWDRDASSSSMTTSQGTVVLDPERTVQILAYGDTG